MRLQEEGLVDLGLLDLGLLDLGLLDRLKWKAHFSEWLPVSLGRTHRSCSPVSSNVGPLQPKSYKM